MVQEIAKKLIRMGKKEEAQDLYFIPRREEYQVRATLLTAITKDFVMTAVLPPYEDMVAS